MLSSSFFSKILAIFAFNFAHKNFQLAFEIQTFIQSNVKTVARPVGVSAMLITSSYRLQIWFKVRNTSNLVLVGRQRLATSGNARVNQQVQLVFSKNIPSWIRTDWPPALHPLMVIFWLSPPKPPTNLGRFKNRTNNCFYFTVILTLFFYTLPIFWNDPLCTHLIASCWSSRPQLVW